MLSSLVSLLAVASGITSVIAQNSTTTTTGAPTEYTITSTNITAKFIPYGARITSLMVPDSNATDTQVIVGYDNPEQYITDSETNHTFFGAVVGRYANRIKNSTFELNGETYHIPANDNGGLDTLHGGTIGYDQRNWTVVAHNDSSISFAFLDQALEGFPGDVYTIVTYTVGSSLSGPQGQARPRLWATLVSSALTLDTPIMLSTHFYWNLNSFKQQTILNDTHLYMPYSTRYIQTDGILIPNGSIAAVGSTPALDFTTPKLLGDNINIAQGVCGTGCTGVDNAFILDRPLYAGDMSPNFPVFSLWSDTTGIQMDVSTNQQGLQVYTCNGQNGTIPVRQSVQQANQGVSGAATGVNQHGCIVVEPQAYIDGINHPEWGVEKYEIFGPSTGPFFEYTTFDFSTF